MLEDPYAIAWKLQKKDKLVSVVVGHIPREISRFVWYCCITSALRTSKAIPNTIRWNGNIANGKAHNFRWKEQYLAHPKTRIERNYQVPEKEEDDLHEQEEDICEDNEDDTIYLREWRA